MIVTLLTDFGTADFYAAAMKGVILSHNPMIRVVDLSHDVPRHDVPSAAYFLLSVYREFPPGTVHVAVIDPGVGSARRPIAIRAGEWVFIGPDNGLFSYVVGREQEVEVRAIESAEIIQQPASNTFHGRDLFAPAGAALATGFPFERVGPKVDRPISLPAVQNVRHRDGSIAGRIFSVDRFGNCITTFRKDDVGAMMSGYRIRVGDTLLDTVRSNYAEAPDDEPFAIWGSTGHLEISIDQGSAAARLGIDPGAEVKAERLPSR